MIVPLLPATADNSYRGHKLALWILGVVVLMRTAISLGSIFNGYGAASGADGIPLDSYPAAASQTILSMYALSGVSRLVLAALAVLVLIRYRSFVPLMFLLLLLEHTGRRIASYYLPIPRVGEPAVSVINLVLLGLMVAGLALSLWPRNRSHPGRTG